MNELPPATPTGRAPAPASIWQRWGLSGPFDPVDHAAILARVHGESGWTARYAFMTLMSAGIAILGLLLSSPAVIIGAMLVSPLMGPIIGLGFALAVLDWPEVRRSLVALGAGAALAIGFTALIVLLSPLQDTTPEILARTRPNLFDLLVAIFSALAGAYATVRGRGETIVGVAIATALMPPLAVVGYGLATTSGLVFGGALALFVTNFIAIALSATAVARFYGFASHLSPDQTRRQTWALVLLFILLALPLAWSLRQIAWETWATRTARTAIASEFGASARLGSLEPEFRRDTMIVRARVFTDVFRTRAAEDLERRLSQALGRPVTVELSQIVVNQDIRREDLERARAVVDREAGTLAARQDIALRLGAALGVNSGEVIIDANKRIASVQAPGERTLGELRRTERWLAARFPDWQIRILPPAVPLPPILFEPASSALEAAQQRQLDDQIWALQRWGVNQVRVRGGRASNEGAAIAADRARTIAEALGTAGMDATVAEPIAPDGSAERELGLAARRQVQIEPVGATDRESEADASRPDPTLQG